jgi:hypothetical protein
MQVIKEQHIKDYTVTFRHNDRNDKQELVLRYNGAGKHFAVHTKVQLVDHDGAFIEMTDINDTVIDELFANLDKYGTTEGMYLTKKENNAQVLIPGPMKMRPEDVRHAKTVQESSYTATGEKLLYHWPIFKKLKETGYGSIIRATMTNHQVCMSHCQYCSTIGRNKKDSVTLEEAKQFVHDLYYTQAEHNQQHFPEYNELYKSVTGSDIRLRGLILSGGGQPNIWPHFEEFVEWLAELDISLGLITNGFPQRINDDIYKHFDWIRLSITPENASPFYPDGKFNLQRMPSTIVNNPDITLGISYVYGPWTEDEILNRLENAANDWGADYVRLLTDCNLSRDIQLRSHAALAERLFSLGLIQDNGEPTGKMFHQLKYHGTPQEAEQLWDAGQCHLQSFNVFWDTTGHEDQGYSSCYPCDSVTVLADEIVDDQGELPERKFNSSKWGTVPNTEVEKLYTEPVTPFFDPKSQCASCLFVKNNQTAKDLSSRDNYDTIVVDDRITHVNFP